MSEIERMLRRCLEPVAQQRRRLRLYRTLGASWLIAGLLGAALAAAYWLAGWWSPLAVGLLVLATAAAVGAAFLQAVRVGEFDYRALADRIEHRHPELRSLLRTAVEQKAREPDGELGYLQRRVIEQALSHAREHPWDRTVSRTQMTLTGVGQLAAMLLFLATLGMLLAPALPGAGAGGSSASDGAYRIEVEPGDTAVERGESVVVVARFDEAVPADASVVIESADEEAGDEPNDAEPASTEDDGQRTPQLSSQQRKRLPLSRNLEDPVLGGTIPEINRDLRYRIEYDGRRSRSYTIRTYAHPALERADARIEPPEHTDREPRTVEDTRHVSAAEGSRLTLKLHLNKPVERARLVAMDDQGEATGRTVAAEPGGADGDETETLSLKPGTEPSPDAVESGTDEPNVYRAAFDLDRSRAYELRLEDAEGRSNKSPPRFTIDVHRNVPPRIELTFPGRDTQVSPLQELPLEAKASDDYGVLGYGLTYSIGGEERTVRLDGGDVETAEAEMRHTLAMERLNAEPGQLLSFHFWAEDRGPDGERRRTAGDLYFAEVRPFERVFREASGGGQQGQQQNQSGMELLQIQKQVMIATWKLRSRHAHSGSGPADGGDTQEAGVIRDSQREALNQARQMRSQVRDEQARSALDEATGRMETALEALGPLADEAPEGEERSTLLEEALTAERGAYQALLKMQGNEHRVTRGQGGGGGGGQRAQRQLSELELTQEDRRYETERQASSQRQRAQEGGLEALQRLRELARRQGDLAERLKELRLALREAETEEVDETEEAEAEDEAEDDDEDDGDGGEGLGELFG